MNAKIINSYENYLHYKKFEYNNDLYEIISEESYKDDIKKIFISTFYSIKNVITIKRTFYNNNNNICIYDCNIISN